MLGISVPIPHSHAAHLQRHGTCTHTGYPFMQLAKETGADYGDVLLYAQYVTARLRQWKDTDDATDEDRAMTRRLSTQVCDRVRYLTAFPVHLRGGNHDQTA